MSTPKDPFHPPLAQRPGAPLNWGGLAGAGPALAIAAAARHHPGVLLLVVPDGHAALRLEQELGWLLGGSALPVSVFPDWETLPYDAFSPHPDIISQRLTALYRLPALNRGVLIVPVATLVQRLAPRQYLETHALLLRRGDRLDLDAFRARLQQAGYACVSQVVDHGEFAVRGSLIDLYPMGASAPYRVDLFDDEVDSIRVFDPDSQISSGTVDAIELLPAREFPLTKDGITHFRQAFRSRFAGDPQACPVYRDVSNGAAPGGIEYYLPLFFDGTDTLFDYLPSATLAIVFEGVGAALEDYAAQVTERHEQLRHDVSRPLLAPDDLFLSPAQVHASLQRLRRVHIAPEAADAVDLGVSPAPMLRIQPRAERPAEALAAYLSDSGGRVLLVTESAGRRELLIEQLRGYDIRPAACDGWQQFVDGDATLAITTGPLEAGLRLARPALTILTETELHGERVRQTRRREGGRDAAAVLRDLTDLSLGAAVVHEDHGVGRYAGLQHLEAAGVRAEFVVLDYADGGRLYVPVAALHLISRYTGASPEIAPLHKLGSDQWQRARRKAAERARDVAAELLEIYARRQARPGHAFADADTEYLAFADAFPFEETADQAAAIDAVVHDMRAGRPMDRVVCGDVGFGKTEVAMRAAFVAVQGGRQVAVLVPTTLLAQQHYQNFLDRFADWPIRIEQLSRFRSRREQDAALAGLAGGGIDIVIGTHKLLQDDIRFQRLGLVIIDEEHRFGVRQKERFKALRAEVDVLTLTATPIPRTLNMALAGLRDLSVIATPPAQRLAVKTFVGQRNDATLLEACQRELKRGGQVYYLHNEVETIAREARALEALVPGARVAVAHGQMRERELEQVMLDFYHQRCNVLVCTTIVESGIDVPSANTMIINRADRLGLAQLHQLRGRVGRSHHRAYCYLMVPPREAMTADALKRIEAIESLEDLGAGFMLANHDMEIRGAGELLGDEQSGQIQEVGFGLYMELLERAVQAIKAGRVPELDRPLDHGAEVDLQMPALIPDDYLPDVHTRLMLYKRIASAADAAALRELQVEMIDRFGLLPEPVKALFRCAELKLLAAPIGVRRIEVGAAGGRVQFNAEPRLDVGKLLTLVKREPQRYRLDGPERLRLTAPLPELEQRATAIETLLQEIRCAS